MYFGKLSVSVDGVRVSVARLLCADPTRGVASSVYFLNESGVSVRVLSFFFFVSVRFLAPYVYEWSGIFIYDLRPSVLCR